MEIQRLKRVGALGGLNGSANVGGPMEIGRLTHHARLKGLGPERERVRFDRKARVRLGSDLSPTVALTRV